MLLASCDNPVEHWMHLRTTNPIESTFATVRLRQRVTTGPGSRAAGIAMAFKLIEAAQARWRAVNAPHLVVLVRVGVTSEKGKLVERPDEGSGGDQRAARNVDPLPSHECGLTGDFAKSASSARGRGRAAS